MASYLGHKESLETSLHYANSFYQRGSRIQGRIGFTTLTGTSRSRDMGHARREERLAEAPGHKKLERSRALTIPSKREDKKLDIFQIFLYSGLY